MSKNQRGPVGFPPAQLDLSGFHRRLPHRAIGWHVGNLRPGGVLEVASALDLGLEPLLTAIRCAGGKVVAEENDGDRRRLTVRRDSGQVRTLELDMRGKRCPIPVIEAQRRLRRMSHGEFLKMVTDCTGAPTEVDTWTTRTADVTLHGAWRQDRNHVFLLARH